MPENTFSHSANPKLPTAFRGTYYCINSTFHLYSVFKCGFGLLVFEWTLFDLSGNKTLLNYIMDLVTFVFIQNSLYAYNVDFVWGRTK